MPHRAIDQDSPMTTSRTIRSPPQCTRDLSDGPGQLQRSPDFSQRQGAAMHSPAAGPFSGMNSSMVHHAIGTVRWRHGDAYRPSDYLPRCNVPVVQIVSRINLRVRRERTYDRWFIGERPTFVPRAWDFVRRGLTR